MTVVVVAGRVLPVVIMTMRRVRLDVTEPFFAVERHEDQAERIQGGKEHADGHGKEGVPMPGHLRQVHGFDDGVLREEACERWNAGQRQRSDHHRPVGDGHVFLEAAHAAHILLVM